MRINNSFFTCPEIGLREDLLIEKEGKRFSIAKSSIRFIDPIIIKFRIKDKNKEYDGLDDSYFCLSEPRDIVNWFREIDQKDLIELRDRFKSGKFSFMEKRT